MTPSEGEAMLDINENERHAVAHARYQCEHASPDYPVMCFDYELVLCLLSLIDRLRAAAQASGMREDILAEHELMRKTLETIAGTAADQLQATQARGALANIGATLSDTSQGEK